MNQKVSGPRHSPKALVIVIARLVVCCSGGGREEERGRRFAADTLFFSLQTRQSNSTGQFFRLPVERLHITKIASLALVSFTAKHPDYHRCRMDYRSTDVIPGHGRLCAVAVTLSDLTDWQHEGWRTHPTDHTCICFTSHRMCLHMWLYECECTRAHV